MRRKKKLYKKCFLTCQSTKEIKKNTAPGHVTTVGGPCDLTDIYIMRRTHTHRHTLKGSHFAVNNMTVRMSDGSH